MSFRTWIVVIGFIALFAIGLFNFIRFSKARSIPRGPVSNMTVKTIEPRTENQGQSLMTPVSGPSGTVKEPAVPGETLIEQLTTLKPFEAAASDLSLCGDDKKCLEKAKSILSWVCAAQACDGNINSPITCFKTLYDNSSIEKRERIGPLICSWIKFPSTETRQALLAVLPSDTSENGLVWAGAYLLALKGSADACENAIKNYGAVAYGPQWDYDSYVALSRCRILARESTREQEEKDFYTWFNVPRGMANCSDIVNNEMRKACDTPGIRPPVPASLGVPSPAPIPSTPIDVQNQ